MPLRAVLMRAVLVLAALTLGVPAQAAETDATPPGRSNWLAPLLPAVVSISTVKFVDDQPGKVPPRRVNGFGSGFVIDPSGMIVTNRHVIEGCIEVRAVLQDGTILQAKSIYVGAEIDLALLKVDAGHPLAALRLGNSDTVEIGDPVVAIGNPLMLGGSVTSGIVSGLNRDIMSSAFDNFIQTDAAINHGNSGGPLVNMRGEVIGLNTAIYSPTATSGSIGIGFAAPSNDVAYIVEQIERFGQVRGGWIGLNAQTVTPEIAQAIGLPQVEGSILTGISATSPAGEAGLREGDVVLSFDGHEPRDSRALARMIAEAPPNAAVPLGVWRDGKNLMLTVKVGEWHDHPMREVAGDRSPAVLVRAETVDYGLRFGQVTEDTRRRLHLDASQKGAVVSEVALNSPAADAGFRAGDLVLRVQMDAIQGPDEARGMLDNAMRARRRTIIVLVQREDGLRWLPLAGTFGQG